MDDPSRPWKKAAFTQTATGRSVRTQRWRYTEWGGPEKAELYDHEAEPSEHTNLAKDPKCAATVKELHELLEKGWRAALP
jgi:arylsulfatase A-like enzyme